jgi:hypothetical protein
MSGIQERLLSKLLILVDQAEKIFFDAYRLQGSDFAMTEPLWLTWTLEHFGTSLRYPPNHVLLPRAHLIFHLCIQTSPKRKLLVDEVS